MSSRSSEGISFFANARESTGEAIFPKASQSSMIDSFLTRRELCERLNVCAATARRWEIARKLTPYAVTGGCVRYRVAEVECLLEQAQRTPRHSSRRCRVFWRS